MKTLLWFTDRIGQNVYLKIITKKFAYMKTNSDI